ncbi:hypothetical protein [Nocardia sp. NPDC005366]|uniref:hypothetical protein n=1 Tax=Nocardia sp. NPDC005366 TaxID=3156878 RepID=UPI0033B3563B
MKSVRFLARWAAYGLAALPISLARVPVRLRVPRRLLGARITPRKLTTTRVRLHSTLGAAAGLVAWFAALLATVALVRGVAYPLVAAHDHENSWGGPTLGGAWLVHAALGVGLLPLWGVLLAGLGAIQVGLANRLLGRTGPWWPVPVSLVLAAGGVLLFVAWLHQI